jgi:hypothetical protein
MGMNAGHSLQQPGLGNAVFLSEKRQSNFEFWILNWARCDEYNS